MSNRIHLKASDPNYSVWVSASAGTGKTKILIDRILRLLLEGADITKIICITYTKEAANEMQERLLSTLANWAISNPDDIDAEIQELCGYIPTEDQLQLASKLFSHVLNNPQEIKIQTIHAFCQSLLAKFPLEAGITPNFITLEKNASFLQKVKEEILQETLQQYYTDKEKSSILEVLITKMGASVFQKNIEKVLDNLTFVNEIYRIHNIDTPLGKPTYKEKLYNFLEVDLNQTSSALTQEFINNFPQASFAALANILQPLTECPFSSYKNEEKYHQLLTLYKNLNATNLEQWCSLFLTRENTIYKFAIKSNSQKQLKADIQQQILTTMLQEGDRVLKYKTNYYQIQHAEINYAFSYIAFDIFTKYQEYKQKFNFLDYDDQVMKAVDLLTTKDIMPWIMFKLDNTIEHILVDEAQDTTPQQWEIIKAFAKEFFSGLSAHEEKKPTPRTIFVVGDIKQSIYRFQGANPSYLNSVKDYLKSLVIESKNSWLELPLTTSYRSAPGIINFVNNISNRLFDKSQKLYLNENLQHLVYDQNYDQPHHIEIWPALIAQKEDSKKSTPVSKKDVQTNTYHINLASRIVDKIIDLHENYNISYKDIYILFAKRNFITLKFLVKLLKDKNVPVLGLDKINLNDSIVTHDLIALIKFILSNEDNLSLACLLKSPLFNLNDQNLLQLKQFAPKNLFQSLEVSPYKCIYKQLTTWIKIGLEEGIVSLLYKVLYLDKGINKFASRLGEDCKDIIRELLNIAIAFANENTTSLTSFLYHIEDSSLAVERDISNNQDYINLLTIHGSKGLQAKAVFLINDTTTNSKSTTTNSKSESLYFTVGTSNLILVMPTTSVTRTFWVGNNLNYLIEQEKKDSLEEKKRLLYVALTRSKNYLYICTITNNHDDINKENNWYSLLKNSASDESFISSQNSSFTPEAGFIDNEVLLSKVTPTLNVPNLLPSYHEIILPKWFYKKAPQENNLMSPLAPSKLNFDDPTNTSPLSKNKKVTLKNIEKGLLIHTILEQINKLNIQDAPFIIESFLSQRKLTATDKKDIATSINNVINNPELSFLFTNPSLNEIAISGLVDFNTNQHLLLGRVDKIVKVENSIIVIDYKYSVFKGKIAPNYVDQLTLYKKLLEKIYPNFKIKAYIIYTTDGTLKEV